MQIALRHVSSIGCVDVESVSGDLLSGDKQSCVCTRQILPPLALGHLHRSSRGTPATADSTCMPHPAHVGLPQSELAHDL